MTTNILFEIAESHLEAWKGSSDTVDQILDRAVTTHTPRDFKAALQSPGIAVIAEIKRRSPSKGDINTNLDPALLASEYVDGGAACLSVLTDEMYFGGSVQDFVAARNSVSVPMLRKDFTVDERDVAVARSIGADAVLLIAAILDNGQLRSYRQLASELGMTALVEIHDSLELKRALESGAEVIGVNQRNLVDFQIDRSLARSMRSSIPSTVVTVAESGIRGPGDVSELAEAGYDAVLVGTTLASSPNPAQSLRELVAG